MFKKQKERNACWGIVRKAERMRLQNKVREIDMWNFWLWLSILSE